jgi:hypothetical protein
MRIILWSLIALGVVVTIGDYIAGSSSTISTLFIPTPKHLESKLEMVSEYRMGGTICCPGA